jgi:hypothetical protein
MYVWNVTNLVLQCMQNLLVNVRPSSHDCSVFAIMGGQELVEMEIPSYSIQHRDLGTSGSGDSDSYPLLAKFQQHQPGT